MAYWLLAVDIDGVFYYAVWKKERRRSECVAAAPAIGWMKGAPALGVKKLLKERRVQYSWILEDQFRTDPP